MAHPVDKHGPAAVDHGGHGHGALDHAAGDDHQHDHDTTKYWMVFGGLCILTTISVGTMMIPGIKETPTIGWTIMMAVSCCKAMLVITFFMHLLWEASWKYVLTIPAATMSLFLIFMLVPDVGCRTWWYTEERAINAADPEFAKQQAKDAEADAAHGDPHSGPMHEGHPVDPHGPSGKEMPPAKPGH